MNHLIFCSAATEKHARRTDTYYKDELVMEANAKVLAYSKFPLDPMFEHNDLKANPDGVYYKVFGKLSAGDITSAEAAEDLMKGIDDCYNF